MPTETFEKGLSLLDSGDLEQARRLAAPLLLNEDARSDALFLLGRAYQLEGKPHIALYLLERVNPLASPAELEHHVEECRAAVQASGWSEDFADRGHALCDNCGLRYRAEFTECPYCSTPEPPDDRLEKALEAEDLGWEDDLLDKADKFGRNVSARARELAGSKSVKEIGDRTRALGKEAVERARKISEKDEVREAVQRAKRAGTGVVDSARKVLEADTAKSIQDSTRETGSSFLKHAREFVREERARYESADDERRTAIVIKWVVVGVAVLVVLRIMAWII